MKEQLFLVEQFLVIVVVAHTYLLMNMIMDRMELRIIILQKCRIIRLYNVWRILIRPIHRGKDFLKFCFRMIFFWFRINQDLRSWVQDNDKKEHESQPVIIPDPKSLTISSNPAPSDSSVVPIQHRTRKVARQTKFVFNN